MAADLSALRPEFERAGTKLTVVSAVETGAQDFLDNVWPGGALYIDEEESVKKALGGTPYKMWWLLKPSVLRVASSFAKRFGFASDDLTDKKTQLTGGVFVVKKGEVAFVHRETSTFDNGDAREILAAALGKDIKDVAATPKTYEEVCTRETAEACAAK